MLSIPDIAIMCGVSRQRMGQIFNKGALPFKPIYRKGEGRKQPRFRDTKELRTWCENRNREWGKKPTPVIPVTPELAARVEGIKQNYRMLSEKEEEIKASRLRLMKHFHGMGAVVCSLKAKLPRGTWKDFLVSKFSNWGRTPQEILSRARDAMKLFSAYPNLRDPKQFSEESVRKFWLRYVAPKWRN
jgi:hypothetical protein